MINLRKLRKVREEVKGESKTFPKGDCMITSYRLKKRLGIEIKSGLFVDDKGNGNTHYWNAQDGKIIDLTASQFGNFPEIYILDENSEEARTHYCEGVAFMI